MSLSPIRVLAATAALGVLAAASGAGPAPAGADEPAPVSEVAGVVPAPEPVPALPPSTIDPTEVRAALAPYLDEKPLGPDVVASLAPLDGTGTVFGSGAESSFIPASTMKLLTAAAALEVLGPEHTFGTRVARQPDRGTEPKSADIVLVGGGDPFLASRPAGGRYPRGADLRTLAGRAAEALRADGVRRVRIGYDSSLFSGPPGASSWPADYLADEVVAPITALWADEGRPASGFGRTSDPAAAAALVFRDALARAGIAARGAPRVAKVEPAATDLAEVTSAPLAQIVERVLEVSDNEAAEVLAHHVGIAETGRGSFSGGATGVAAALTRLGIPLDGAKIYDGSGLSRANRLRAGTLIAVLRAAADPERPELRAVLSGLPVAGFSGSLAYRFSDGPPAGRGQVRAKTGTLTGVHALAGTVLDESGNLYLMVLAADRVRRNKSLAARLALDRAAAALASCSCAPG
ncbi:MAG: D-alanyl-D-alanine carboxypeptidase/D-alanyl-D-alanine endopeptidase [Nocardioides sp.]